VTTIDMIVKGFDRQDISASNPGFNTGNASWLKPAWTAYRTLRWYQGQADQLAARRD